MVFSPTDELTRYQLYRALKGSVLREEVYGLDETPLSEVPYSVQSGRSQVRLQQARSPAGWCVVLPTTLEGLSVGYERITADPQVQQQVTLQLDAFGAAVWTVAVSYARRPQPSSNPYPATVPNELWVNTYDEGQWPLRLSEGRSQGYNLSDPSVWRLGLPYLQRQNVLTYATDYGCYPLTANGLSYEALRAANGLLGASQPRVFAGQAVTFYFDAAGTGQLAPGRRHRPWRWCTIRKPLNWTMNA